MTRNTATAIAAVPAKQADRWHERARNCWPSMS